MNRKCQELGRVWDFTLPVSQQAHLSQFHRGWQKTQDLWVGDRRLGHSMEDNMSFMFLLVLLSPEAMGQCRSICYTWGFPGGIREPACQCRRHKRCSFNPWIRWKKAWQPTPVLLSGESRGQRSLLGYSHRVAKSGIWLEQLSIHAIYTVGLFLSQEILVLENILSYKEHLPPESVCSEKKAILCPQRDTIFIFHAVCSTNIFANIVQNKRFQCLCSEDGRNARNP